MPKIKSRAKKEQAGVAGTKRAAKTGAKQAVRLEKALDRVRAAQAKRSAQLERLQVRAAELSGRLAAVRASAERTVEPATAPSGTPVPSARAYCMRDKRMVDIHDPELVMLRNGRRALAGTCLECGTHVVAIVGGPAHVLDGERIGADSRPSAEA